MIKLTYDEVRADLLALAAERPDYVYESPNDGNNAGMCVYFNEGAPSCIVGHVFARHGVTRLPVADNIVGVSTLYNRNPLVADSRTRRLLNCVQNMQDSGESWGNAVAKALRAVK